MDAIRFSLAASLLLATSPLAAAATDAMPASVTSRISAIVARTMDYPAEAKPREEQGVAVVGFTVGNAGMAEAIALVRSSGHSVLDTAALQTIARLRGLPGEAAGHHTFAVLQYRMSGPGQDPEGARNLRAAVGALLLP